MQAVGACRNLSIICKRHPENSPEYSVFHTCRQSVLVSATLHSKLGSVAAELLNDPVAVGLQLQRDEGGAVMLAEDGPVDGAFLLPKSLQQLYMEVPVKMRLPSLLGTRSTAAAL